MNFYYTKRSPYARKVLLTAYAFSCIDRINLIEVDLMNKPSDLLQANPIGRIPCLVDKENVYYDSNVCCLLLETQHHYKRPIDIENLCALCDGLMDISVDWFKETLRPENMQSEHLLSKFKHTIDEILSLLNTKTHLFPTDLSPHSIALISALGYLQFRFPTLKLNTYANLKQWESLMTMKDSVQKTHPC